MPWKYLRFVLCIEVTDQDSSRADAPTSAGDHPQRGEENMPDRDYDDQRAVRFPSDRDLGSNPSAAIPTGQRTTRADRQQFLSTKEAARFLGLHHNTLCKWRI